MERGEGIQAHSQRPEKQNGGQAWKKHLIRSPRD